MEANRGMKHMCKFCYKSFPCGRSLGGHMRSHLINVSPSDHQNSNKKFPKKKLPPLINNAKIDIFSIRDHHPNKGLKSNDENVLMTEKLCKECGKSLPSWKALFDHMKSHSGNGKANSLNVSSYSQSDDESETRFCRKKRSERTKRYIATSTNSSSLNIANFSPCVSEIDQHEEEEEVALSLIMLSKDNMGISSDDKYRVLVEFEGNDSEVNSPRNFIRKRGLNQFETDFKRKRSLSKRKLIDSQYSSILTPVGCKINSDSNKDIKFTCTICKRAFSSYQALGGHRASHKKFNGCCAPKSKNNIETESSLGHTDNLTNVFVLKMDSKIGLERNKDHECPMCFKIFSSGQALGGHKRSHITGDQAKMTNSPLVEKSFLETRNFLDLNFPAPVEENCNELRWISGAHNHEEEGFLGLMSS